MSTPGAMPAAVVVGLCAHGLGLVRDLHRAGIRVVAIESDRSLPGTRTREAELCWAPDINRGGLIGALLETHTAMNFGERPVLFLTNDRMVETIGSASEAIAGKFRLSWSGSAREILRLQRKDRIEARCGECGLHYPRSVVLHDVADFRSLADLSLPIIFKPVRPLSEFKTLVAHSAQDLARHRALVSHCLPVVAQEFIPGDDDRIRFGALCLDRGREIARFEGRKLQSRPMGHTTIAVPEADDRVHELAHRFFDGLDLSGPVSLEVKEGPDGRFWVIEPTVGRTDFWAGLCSANGINLPLIEYRIAIGAKAVPARQAATHVWINGERHPSAPLWLASRAFGIAWRHAIRGVYADLRDPAPWVAASARQVARLPSKAAGKLAKVVLRPPRRDAAQNPVTSHSSVADLPADARALLDAAAGGNVEGTSGWFENLHRTVYPEDPGIRFFVQRRDGAVRAVLPARLGTRRGARRVEALGNFYTSLYSPAVTAEPAELDLAPILAAAGTADVMDFHPLDPESRAHDALLAGLTAIGWKPFRYFCFGNWYLKADRPWTEYLAQRSGTLRSTLRRKGKRFQAADGRLDIATTPEEAEAAIRAFGDVYARSWKQPEPYPDFIPGLARWLAATGRLRLGIARLSGQPIAAQLWIVDGARACIYKLAYDEAFADFAPGTLLTAHLLEHVMERDRVAEVDYLIGDDAYKRDWMSHRRERWGIVAYNTATPLGLAGLAQEAAARALRRLRPTR